MTPNMILLASILLMVLVLPSVNAQSFPTWIQDMAGWYSDGSIDDAEYIKSLQFLIDEKIIKIPQEIVYVEIIKEVQAQPIQNKAVDLTEVWKAIGHLQQEYELTVKHDYDEEVLQALNQVRDKMYEVEARAWDNEKRIEILKTPVNQDPNIDWEKRYDRLWDLYDKLSLRVVDLERKHLD